MKFVSVSDGHILIPQTTMEKLMIWMLSFSIGEYNGKCANECAYPKMARLKIPIK